MSVRVSDAHCPRKLATMCIGCPHFSAIAEMANGGRNYYCLKEGVVC